MIPRRPNFLKSTFTVLSSGPEFQWLFAFV